MTEQTIGEQFPWAIVGAEAVIYEQGSWGYVTTTRAKITRVSTARITLEGGRTFYVPKYRNTLSEWGRDVYRSPELIAPGDPRVTEAVEAQRKQKIRSEAMSAVKKWLNSSSDVDTAQAAVTAIQAFIEAHKDEQ